MGILDSQFLGIRIFIWLYFAVSIIGFIAIVIYWKRDIIKEKYIKFRFPQKVIKIVIHYPSKLYKVYWRLIPDESSFKIDKRTYYYSDEQLQKENDFYVFQQDNKLIAKIEDKTYQLADTFKIKETQRKYPEIHYLYSNPIPLDFGNYKDKFAFDSAQLTTFQENDLFKKLLTLEMEKNLLTILMLMVGFNILATIFLIAKAMGWLK